MIQKIKGTQDIYGDKGAKYSFLQNYIYNFMKKYNYEYIMTPAFESTSLFKRVVGESTDIVSKETYDFKDKSERELTLRPEMTASVARCLIENKLYNENSINKYYYVAPCYRYERPQEGRYREFTQFGVEVFGSTSPYLDVEVISLAYNFITSLGIENIKVLVNTLGSKESRNKYNEVLKEYFSKNIDNLCETCKERLNKNPLRILDCKVDAESVIIKNAPKTIDYLDENSKNRFDEVINALKKMNINYEINTNLVRGLDYYTDTVFEIVSTDKNNNLGTICGGGRYDGLINQLGSDNVPGIGFALGIDRLTYFMQFDEKPEVDAFILNIDNNNETYMVANNLRNNGFNVELDYNNRNIKGQYKLVDKTNPKFILMIGQDEINNNYISVKDNLTKEVCKVSTDEIVDYLNVNI